MSEKIKFNYALESEGGALYKKYCDEKSIDYKVTAAANFCLGYMAEKSSPMWVKASDRLPQIIDKKCKPRFVKVEEKRRDGSLRITKAVAYYFPEHFKTVEWEDWDDYSEEDFPYTESDEERGVVWLRPGWYSSIECDKCEGYWSAPLNVIEWYDE